MNAYEFQQTIDMVERKQAVDPAIDEWKKQMEVKWEAADNKWESDYDAQLAKEAEEEAEEKARWDNMTEEEKKAEMDSFAFVSDNDSSDDDSSDDEYSNDEEWFDETEEDENISPEERKAKDLKEYNERQAKYREKRLHEVWDNMLRCSWKQLLEYRSELGLNNDKYQSHRYHCNRDTNQLY